MNCRVVRISRLIIKITFSFAVNVAAVDGGRLHTSLKNIREQTKPREGNLKQEQTVEHFVQRQLEH